MTIALKWTAKVVKYIFIAKFNFNKTKMTDTTTL